MESSRYLRDDGFLRVSACLTIGDIKSVRARLYEGFMVTYSDHGSYWAWGLLMDSIELRAPQDTSSATDVRVILRAYDQLI